MAKNGLFFRFVRQVLVKMEKKASVCSGGRAGGR